MHFTVIYILIFAVQNVEKKNLFYHVPLQKKCQFVPNLYPSKKENLKVKVSILVHTCVLIPYTT